jgi:hypothetical protein
MCRVMSQEFLENSPNQTENSGLLPPPLEPVKTTLWEEIGQGWAFVVFVWRVSRRIRGNFNRVRFVIGLIFWKPFLPNDR